ncbi:MAG: 16S rRNA (uracil(1498)-N(3))-methyltransferase [Methylocystis sp.]|nr:MAG: 16S rRNA (uracil(1498)-N(3))-methyltransferase [Methylocystis sp.]
MAAKIWRRRATLASLGPCILPHYDFSAQRLHVENDLLEGADVAPTPEALNYLVNVLRLREGDPIVLFNGRDGEFLAHLREVTRRSARLRIGKSLRLQTARPDLDYCFSPLKQARLDYIAQKATEMGAGRLVPVITRRTQVRRVNSARLRANAIEAAEQCGVIAVPEVTEAVELPDFLAAFPAGRTLVFCDEDAPLANPVSALSGRSGHGVSLLIGPEGGFDDTERAAIARLPGCVTISLGPRILRADTAGVAALALLQATLGDWGGGGRV